MQIRKAHYFNAYACLYKLASLLICCLLFACSGQNKTKQILSIESRNETSESAININIASAAALEKLPQIGGQTAREIIEHRAKFGRFRKAEHLMFVRGISDERFRELKSLVKVE